MVEEKKDPSSAKATEDKEEGKLVGEVTHFFPHVSAAVVKLKSPLKIGDKIKIVGGKEGEFEQEVTSMQIDRQPIEKGKTGDEVGLEVIKKVHEGNKVYLM